MKKSILLLGALPLALSLFLTPDNDQKTGTPPPRTVIINLPAAPLNSRPLHLVVLIPHVKLILLYNHNDNKPLNHLSCLILCSQSLSPQSVF